MTNNYWDEVLKEEKLTPFARPTVDVTKVSDTELQLKFVIVLPPEVELGQYKGLALERDKVEVKPEEVDAAMVSELKLAIDSVIDSDDVATEEFAAIFSALVDALEEIDPNCFSEIEEDTDSDDDDDDFDDGDEEIDLNDYDDDDYDDDEMRRSYQKTRYQNGGNTDAVKSDHFVYATRLGISPRAKYAADESVLNHSYCDPTSVKEQAVGCDGTRCLGLDREQRQNRIAESN